LDVGPVLLDGQVVVPDLNQVPIGDLSLAVDALPVDANPVVAVEVLDLDVAVDPKNARVLARDVALGKTDRVSLVTPDGDLGPGKRDHRAAALGVFNDQLHRAGQLIEKPRVVGEKGTRRAPFFRGFAKANACLGGSACVQTCIRPRSLLALGAVLSCTACL